MSVIVRLLNRQGISQVFKGRISCFVVSPLKGSSRRSHCFSTSSLDRKMSSEAPLLSKVVACSVSIAKGAAQVVRNVMDSGELGTVEKTGAADLQTRADRSAQSLILSSLRKAFPGIVAIGEEDESEQEAPDVPLVTELDKEALSLEIPEHLKNIELQDICVWVDPLDGTKEYTEGYLDHVTILIGIAVKEEAVAGVVNQPYYNYQAKDGKLGRTMYGIVGSGVRGIQGISPPDNERIVTSSRSHSTGLINDCMAVCNPTKEIRAGGSGHKVILLIEGKAHAYVFPSPGTKKWDTCGPEAIVHALGGKLTDIWGKKYSYSKDATKVNEWGILATAVADQHDDYLKLIPDEMKAKVKDSLKKRN